MPLATLSLQQPQLFTTQETPCKLACSYNIVGTIFAILAYVSSTDSVSGNNEDELRLQVEAGCGGDSRCV